MNQTRLRVAVVRAITGASGGRQELIVQVDGEDEQVPAISYPGLSGLLVPGERVVVNTTAVSLALGTGGYHFVVCRLEQAATTLETHGHAMKLRYTPLQLCCSLVEERMAHLPLPWDIRGMPVAVCEIHSQLPLVIAGIRSRLPAVRLAYILTEGGALPAAWSHLLGELRATGLIDAVISVGQAFGGDWEAVNVYSALVAARHLLRCQAAVIAMGPGQLGTGTPLGFSGTEQADNVNRVMALRGTPVVVLRLSQADARPRHRGVSHHTVTVLGQLLHHPCLYAFPRELVPVPFWQKQRQRLADHHRSQEVRGYPAIEYLRQVGLSVRTMGRTYASDPPFFLAAGAAGRLLAGLVRWPVRVARYSRSD